MALGTGAALLLGSGISAAAGVAGAGKAADATKDASSATVGLQRDVYEDITSRMEPHYEAGTDSLSALLYELGLGDAPIIGGTAPTVETVRETIPGQPDTRAGRRGREEREYDWPVATSGAAAKEVTRYKVGENVFNTMEEAQAYAKANPEGGRVYEGYSMSPMARYALTEGLDSIGASAIGRGSLNSGAALKAAEDYRYGVVTRDRGEYLDRLTGMATTGQNAAANLASAGQSFGATAGSAIMAGGQAASQGIINATNAIQGGIGNFANIYGYMNPMQSYTQSYAPTSSIRPQANPGY